MTLDDAKTLVNLAVVNLFQNQPTLSDFTSKTNQSEWNIAHHLANELHALFEAYDCDVDVIKPTLGARRPDIIIHKRGTHEDNAIVVELKRDDADVNSDIEKIKTYWFDARLNYQFGAAIAIDEGVALTVEVFENENYGAQREQQA